MTCRITYLPLALCLTLFLSSHTAGADSLVSAPTGERVVMQILLMRHGIRAPTKSPEALAVYATHPWPTWPVSPGQLTPHGAKLMNSLGQWYHRSSVIEGLSLSTCQQNPAGFKVIADSTPRNRASAAALIEGFSPDCAINYEAFEPGHIDPLFHGQSPNSSNPPPELKLLPLDEIKHLEQVLLGCSEPECLAHARAAGKSVLLDEKPAKALKQAGSLAENLMLIYAEGMPMSQVGWGQLNAQGIGQLINLHNISFSVNHMDLPQARTRGGNMLAHITATLAAAANIKSDLKPLVSKSTHTLFLIGHDTDLASQAGLLDLDWSNKEQPDNFPPGGALIFQLIELKGKYAVRLRIALPTLTALRAGDVNKPSALHIATLRLKSCGNQSLCPLPQFLALVNQAVPPENILQGSGDEPMAH